LRKLPKSHYYKKDLNKNIRPRAHNRQLKRIADFLLLAFLLITGVWHYRKHQRKRQLQRKLEAKLAKERREALENSITLVKSLIPHIEEAEKRFSKLLELDTGYFSNYQLQAWKSTFNSLFLKLGHTPIDTIPLEQSYISSIKHFQHHYTNCETLRETFNRNFIQYELEKYSDFFDNIENRKLDMQQRTSVISNEDNNLVVAGAGSGKTTTIVGKVNYTVHRYKVNPNQVLLISFTRKSASELAKRINIPGIDAKTFHKFGIDVICDVEGKQPSIYDSDQFKSFTIKTFNELLQTEDYIKNVTQYFMYFLKREKQEDEFNNQGEYVQYLKDQNFKAYQQKEIYVNGRRTLRMEIVKSIQECRIANFLLFNSVEYEYELPYEHNTATKAYRQYKPDFTINPKGNKVYLEHFAINRNGTVPEWFAHREKGETWAIATERYNEGIKWKRSEHNKYSTPLLETYSYEMLEGTLFDNLTNKLLDVGINLKPKSPQEIWNIISESAKQEVEGIITLFQTFITLMKSNNYSIENVIDNNSKIKDNFEKQRNSLFLEIIKPIYEKYESHLAERNEIDYSDMIAKAEQYLAAGKYQSKFKYIIIDEFQDISMGRYNLIKAIKTNNPDCKLFAVGDDWQSIYRFTGSDISLFKEFEEYFGCTVKSKIETTYRFKNPLIDLSSDFILKNPNQQKKSLKGIDSLKTTGYKIVYSHTENQDDTSALKEVLDNYISNDKNIARKKILILGRYSFDIGRIKNEQSYFQINETTGSIKYVSKNSNNKTSVQIQFLTIHKAKGLEADYVIVLNCNSGSYGFPSQTSDDMVLNLLLSEADQFENGEERRLFYVAMTRAKEHVTFIANSKSKSKFIEELEVDKADASTKKCPRCKTSDLKLITGGTNDRKWSFYGCSNYVYGCDYQQWQ
jgi:DNA helicase-4